MSKPTTGIVDIAYVRFAISDQDKQREFLSDFGFSLETSGDSLFGRGTDPKRYVYVAEPTSGGDSSADGGPQFLGLGFEAESQADLERIAAIDGVPIEPLTLPGGGVGARLTDPNGFAIDVVYGVEPPTPMTPPSRQPLNFGNDRNRLGERVSFTDTQTSVKRLGHCVVNVIDFRASEAWYKERFGLLTSDEVYIGTEDKVLGAFMRCNRGERFVDHHTLFLVGTGTPGFNHAAFEVADWDTLMLGHDQLGKKGYEHRWGVGKHLLGSQVFDYWKDPSGFTLEHFTDGDLVNESFGSHKAPVEQLLGAHWGPEGSP